MLHFLLQQFGSGVLVVKHCLHLLDLLVLHLYELVHAQLKALLFVEHFLAFVEQPFNLVLYFADL